MENKQMIAIVAVVAIIAVIGAAFVLTSNQNDNYDTDDSGDGGSGDSGTDTPDKNSIASIQYYEGGKGYSYIVYTAEGLINKINECEGDVTIYLHENLVVPKSLDLKVGSKITNLTIEMHGFMISSETSYQNTIVELDIDNGNVVINGGDSSIKHDVSGWYDTVSGPLSGACLIRFHADVNGGSLTINDTNVLAECHYSLEEGSILVATDCTVNMANCIVGYSENSMRSIMMLNDNVKMNLDSTTITGNYSPYDRGLVYVPGKDVKITGSGGTSFSDNDSFVEYNSRLMKVVGANCSIFGISYEGYEGVEGSAIYVDSDASNCTIQNCAFSNNTADIGTVYVKGDDCSIFGCIFVNNKSSDYGSAIYVHGNASNCTIQSAFSYNEAGSDGTVYVDGETCKITNCTFNENIVEDDGSAIYIDGGYACIVSNCQFTGNVADDEGTVYVDKKACKVTSCTFTGNKSDDGIVYLSYYSYSDTSSSKLWTDLDGCVFTDNTILDKDSFEIAGMGDEKWTGTLTIDGKQYHREI